MIELTHHITTPAVCNARLTLPYDLRQKSRFRSLLDNGDEVGLLLPRGSVLQHGDLLRSEAGFIVEINAAIEQVSTAHTQHLIQLARVCYHLGNRHLPIQISLSWVRYLHDHVIDDMVRGLGLTVNIENAPFEPETGAYHQPHQHSLHTKHSA